MNLEKIRKQGSFISKRVEKFYIDSSYKNKLLFSSIYNIKEKSKENQIFVSEISLSDNSKIKCIIKTPLIDRDDYRDALKRSFFIASKLCKISHNFQQPLFLYEKSAYYKHIEGDTMEKHIPTLTSQEFLEIFLQIVIALEIAQEKLKFCHYDLHLKNIILERVNKPFLYETKIRGNLVKIYISKWVPKIIDYGLSCITINFKGKRKTIGCWDFFKYGIFPRCLKGVDIYKFLFNSYVSCNKEVKIIIKNILGIYGENDPYKLAGGVFDVNDVSSEYLKLASYSKVAEVPPIKFLEWILYNNLFSL